MSPLLPRAFAELDDLGPATLREWILDGMPRRVRQDPESREVARAASMSVAGLQPHDSIPTLVALRHHFEAIRRAELTRLERKLAALSPDVRTRLDEITRLLVEKLLLTPTEQLASVDDGPLRVRYAGALNRLFQLTAGDADTVEDSGPTGFNPVNG